MDIGRALAVADYLEIQEDLEVAASIRLGREEVLGCNCLHKGQGHRKEVGQVGTEHLMMDMEHLTGTEPGSRLPVAVAHTSHNPADNCQEVDRCCNHREKD